MTTAAAFGVCSSAFGEAADPHAARRTPHAAEAALVIATCARLGRCHACRAWSALRYVTIRPRAHGGRLASGSERWLLCPLCLAAIPHRIAAETVER